MNAPKLIETGDGSHSLYIREMNETYHSTHGALSESKHVFLASGVQFLIESEQIEIINILEVGFGTGLNALMMLDFARQHTDLQFSFHTLEPYPLDESIYSQLNFSQLLEGTTAPDLLKMHTVAMGEGVQFDNFKFLKESTPVQTAEFNNHYNVIFFDAFAPNKQADMWGVEIMRKMFDALKVGGVFVTYCAQGQFKRDLKAAGFEVQTLEGPPGKKEMVRGVKKAH